VLSWQAAYRGIDLHILLDIVHVAEYCQDAVFRDVSICDLM